MSETVIAPECTHDQTAEVNPSDPPPEQENKEVQDTAVPGTAPVIVWRTLMLEQ